MGIMLKMQIKCIIFISFNINNFISSVFLIDKECQVVNGKENPTNIDKCSCNPFASNNTLVEYEIEIVCDNNKKEISPNDLTDAIKNVVKMKYRVSKIVWTELKFPNSTMPHEFFKILNGSLRELESKMFKTDLNFNEESFEDLSTGLLQLKLYGDGNNIESTSILGKMKNLQELDIFSNSMENINLQDFANMENLETLSKLESYICLILES